VSTVRANPLEGLRVGYAPYTTKLDTPGDRRRFCHYATRRGIEFEIADPRKSYDVVVLSARADIDAWSRHPDDGTRIVYDLIDSYLLMPHRNLRNALRGMGKFASRELSRPVLSYHRAMERMCERADAIVCTTEEQRAAYLRYCDNVQLILDVHLELGDLHKTDYSLGPVLNLVWEGLPYTLDSFLDIAPVLRELAEERPCALHLVTDLTMHRLLGRYIERDTTKLAERIMRPTYLYEWNAERLGSIVTACDIALIPLKVGDPLFFNKPENKLLIFWRLGMPTLTTATPAYARAMEAAGMDLACTTLDDWARQIRRLADDEALRRSCGESGRAYVERNHDEDGLLSRWDRLFESVLAQSRSGS